MRFDCIRKWYFMGLTLVLLSSLLIAGDAYARTCVIVGASNEDRASWDNQSDTHQSIVAFDALSVVPGLSCRWYSYVLRGESIKEQILTAYAEDSSIDVLVIGHTVEIFLGSGVELANSIASTWRVVKDTTRIVVMRYPPVEVMTRDNHRINQEAGRQNIADYNRIVSGWPVLLHDYPIYETFDQLHGNNKTNYVNAMSIYLTLVRDGF